MCCVKKPRSMWGLTGWVFLILGAAFLLCGLLSQAGIMRMKPGSQGDPRVVFPIMGCAFLMAGAGTLLMAILKEKSRKLLLQIGTPVTGKVVSVDQLSFTTWGTSHPYVVHFTYENDGMPYHGKSCLLWTLPTVKEDDTVTVMVDEESPKHSALKL